MNNKTFALMKAYANLDKLERAVIDELFPREFTGTYADLTMAVSKPKSISNIRKAVLRLKKKGVVHIDEQINERGQKKQKKIFALNIDWLDCLVKEEEGQ